MDLEGIARMADCPLRLTCVFLGDRLPEASALECLHEEQPVWLQDLVTYNSQLAKQNLNGYVVVQHYREVRLGGHFLFFASMKQITSESNTGAMIRLLKKHLNISELSGINKRLSLEEFLRVVMTRGERGVAICSTPTCKEGRIIMLDEDDPSVRRIWNEVDQNRNKYALSSKAQLEIGLQQEYLRKLSTFAVDELQARLARSDQFSNAFLLSGTSSAQVPSALAMTDRSQKREAEEYGFGPNKAPRTQAEIDKARYGEAVLNVTRLRAEMERVASALMQAERELVESAEACRPPPSVVTGAASGSADETAIPTAAARLVSVVAGAASHSADATAFPAAADAAVTPTALPVVVEQPVDAAMSTGDVPPLPPSLVGAAEAAQDDASHVCTAHAAKFFRDHVTKLVLDAIVKALSVKARVPAAQRLAQVIGASSPNNATEDEAVRLKMSALELMVQALTIACAVSFYDAVAWQVTLVQWRIMALESAREAPQGKRNIVVTSRVAGSIRDSTARLEGRIEESIRGQLACTRGGAEPSSPERARSADEHRLWPPQGPQHLSAGLEVTHLIAAPAFDRVSDKAFWKHDALALTEAKLWHGAWTQGVITVPAWAATYLVMLDMEVNATPASSDLAGMHGADARENKRSQLQAAKLESLYEQELLSCMDPTAGYLRDLDGERLANVRHPRWASDASLRVQALIGRAELEGLELCRSGAADRICVVCISGMALVDSRNLSQLQVTTPPRDLQAANETRARLIAEAERLQDEAEKIKARSMDVSAYDEAMRPLLAGITRIRRDYKATYHGITSVSADDVASALEGSIARALRQRSSLGGETPPVFVVLLMWCQSSQTAAALVAKGLGVRLLVVSTLGQWPGSETCSVLKAVLDHVDPEGDPSMDGLVRAIKCGLKRDYDTATQHSLTQGHGDSGQPEDSWEGLLDFTRYSPD